MKTKKIIRSMLFGLIFSIFAGCSAFEQTPVPNPGDILAEMGIESETEFGNLPTCEKVEVYSRVGRYYLDIHHGLVLVPTWMDRELDDAPTKDMASCISEKGQHLLSLMNNPKDRREISKQIHVLIIKASNLDIFNFPEIRDLTEASMCNRHVDYRGAIAILYYVETHSNLENFPEVNEIFSTYCK